MRRAAWILAAALALGLAPDGNVQAASRRVGLLGPAEPRFAAISVGLRHGLRDHGYANGSVEVLEARVPRGDRAAAVTAVGRLGDDRVEVLFVVGSELAKVARDAAPRLPIVFLTPGDPVAAGLVASLASPGGNLTGMTFEYPELTGKRLELLKELAPKLRSVLVVFDPADASPRQAVAVAREAANRLDLVLIERPARSREELSAALGSLKSAEALLAVPGGLSGGFSEDLLGAAHAARRPTMFYARTEVTKAALATYGADEVQIARQAARLVDRILKGTRAGELPVERPVRLEFTVNLRVAEDLGLSVSPALLLRADRVIR